MPKLLSEITLNQITYKSRADYMKRVDNLDDFEDKMAFTIRYLLAYGAGAQRDVSLAEAIHIAKVKIAEASAKLREDRIMVPDEAVNPDVSDELDAANRYFMIEPVDYLKQQADALLMKEAQSGAELNAEAEQRIANYQLMSATLANQGQTLATEVSELDIEPTARDVEARLKAKFGGAAQFEAGVKATKPGVFSKAFGTSSTAYHNLNQAYEAFFNPDHANYGNMNALDKAATEYLQHVFPRWDPKKGLMQSAPLNRLSGTQKARAQLSLNILKATAEQRKVGSVYETIISSNIQARADREANLNEEAQDINNEQFQQEVQNELVNEEQQNLSQDERDYHANFEIGPDDVEEENDGPELA